MGETAAWATEGPPWALLGNIYLEKGNDALNRRVLTHFTTILLTDDDYRTRSLLRLGAGHRVGIQNLPAGGPPTADRRQFYYHFYGLTTLPPFYYHV